MASSSGWSHWDWSCAWPSAVPVDLELAAEDRLPEPVEVAAYYVVSEALTNTTKHASASHARVAVEHRDGVLWLSVGDDGVGGADLERGSGLIGLRDRVEAIGGSIQVTSLPGEGTVIAVELPLRPA
jgi:signal transduction histidine kinase